MDTQLITFNAAPHRWEVFLYRRVLQCRISTFYSLIYKYVALPVVVLGVKLGVPGHRG
jgi:hypothetical protein